MDTTIIYVKLSLRPTFQLLLKQFFGRRKFQVQIMSVGLQNDVLVLYTSVTLYNFIILWLATENTVNVDVAEVNKTIAAV
jgi:hypothetical protein